MPATCSFCHQFLICSILALLLQLLPLQLLVWFPPSSQPLHLALAELPQGGRRERAWKCGLELAWGFSLFILTEKKRLSWGAVPAVKLLYCSSRGPDDHSQCCQVSQKRLYLQLQGIRCAFLASGWHCIHVHRNSTCMRAACIHMRTHTHTVKI